MVVPEKNGCPLVESRHLSTIDWTFIFLAPIWIPLAVVCAVAYGLGWGVVHGIQWLRDFEVPDA